MTNSFSFSMTDGVGVDASHSNAVTSRAAKAAATSPEQALYLNQVVAELRSGAPGPWSDDRYNQARHFLDVVYMAVNACANAASSCEVHVTTGESRRKKEKAERNVAPDSYRRATGLSRSAAVAQDAHQRRRVDDSHPVADLLNNPNPVDTTEDLLYEMVMNLRLEGSGLLWQVPNDLTTNRGYDATAEVYVIPTSLAPAMPRSPQYPNGAYRLSPMQPYWGYGSFGSYGSGAGAIIPAEQITAVRYKHPFYKFDGYAPLTAGARLLDILEEIHRSWANAHRNGINPSATLESDPMKGATAMQPDERERIQSRFDEKWAGSGNYGRLCVLPAGYALKPYSNTPAEMAFGESWMMIVEAVLGLFGVPKAVLGWMENYSYAGLYAALKAFYLLSIRPDVRKIAAHLTKFLAWRYDPDLRIELVLPTLDDPQLLEQQLANDLRARSMTRDEWRAKRGMVPIGGDVGEELVGFASERISGGEDDSAERPGDKSVGDEGRPKNAAGVGSKGDGSGKARSASRIRRERDMEPDARGLYETLVASESRNGNGVH